MKSNINDKDQFKCINFLFIFYISYDIFICLIDCKYLLGNFNLHLLILTSALMGFSLILDDIITEVYGIKNAARFYFSMALVRMIMTIPFYAFYSHLTVAKYFLFITFYHPIAYTFAWYVNVQLLTKWKALMQGKYFWLRSMGTSGIAVLIICLFSIVEDVKFSSWSLHQIFFYDFLWSIILIILFNVIFAFFASFIVKILKIIEFPSNYTNIQSFNPFRKSSSKLSKPVL